MKLKSQRSKYKKEDNVYLKYNFLLNIYSDIMLYVHMYSLGILLRINILMQPVT